MLETKVRQGIIKALCELQDVGLEFILVHDRDNNRIGKDIDIIAKDIAQFKSVIKAIGYFPLTTHHWVKRSGASWVVLDLSDKYHFFGGCINVNDYEEIFKNSVPVDSFLNISKLSNFDLAVYTFFKGALVRGYFPDKYLDIIGRVSTHTVETQFNDRYCLLPNTITYYFNQIEKLKSRLISENEIISDIQKQMNIAPKPKSIFTSILRRIKKMGNRNRAIAIVGPDGCGKSSIASELSNLPLMNVKYMGPGQGDKEIMPLFRITRDALGRLRTKTRKTTVIGKLARALFCIVLYIDYILRLYSQKWKMDSEQLVFFDRYAFDVYIRNPDKFRKLLFVYLFPKPKLIILLKGIPEEIHFRKPELTVKQINDTYSRYHDVLAQNMTVDFVNTTRSDINQSLQQLVAVLFKHGFIPLGSSDKFVSKNFGVGKPPSE